MSVHLFIFIFWTCNILFAYFFFLCSAFHREIVWGGLVGLPEMSVGSILKCLDFQYLSLVVFVSLCVRICVSLKSHSHPHSE